ncbi:MAG: phytoene desaturase family protein [Acidimicrobiales bacterium]
MRAPTGERGRPGGPDGGRHFDAVVIGAGVGGLCAAARLAKDGRRVLLAERGDRVGGRASTVEIDGFLVNTGAVAIEYGGVMEQTFHGVGAPWDIRVPDPSVLFRIRGRDVDLSKGGFGKLVQMATRKGAGLIDELGRARSGELPDQEMTTKEWLSKVTSNHTLHAVFRNLCAAIFAANSDEIPARAFLTYFVQKGAFRKFGFCPNGTLGLVRGLAGVVERHGGEVWLSSDVERVDVAGGLAGGATVRREGVAVEVTAGAVVSNTGPARTVELCGREHFDAGYLARMERELRPTANIVVNFASQRALLDAPGILTFATTRRLCNMANLTATCPELAPPGWNLYVAYGVPIPSVGDFDEEHEISETLADLRDQLPGFADDARILSVKVMKGDEPAQRSIAGHDMPRETPVANLWNVGDGVRTYANGGTQACAETAKLVVDQVLSR